MQLFKMNIEGAELLALPALSRQLAIVPHRCVSCHDSLGTEWGRTRQGVKHWLTARAMSVLQHQQLPATPWVVDEMFASREHCPACPELVEHARSAVLCVRPAHGKSRAY